MNKNYISNDKSIMLKAIAIFIVMIGHIAGRYGMSEYHANMLGVGGVYIFLILSGYGLYSSYLIKGISFKGYWETKINKVFIPYIIITLLYNFLFSKCEIEILLKNVLCIDYDRNIDGTMWYMSFLIIWYVIFFITYYFDYSRIVKIIILFLFACFFKDAAFSWFDNCSWQFSINAFAFPIGVLIANVEDLIKMVTENKRTSIKWCILIFFGSSIIYMLSVFQKVILSYGQSSFVLFLLCYMLIFIIDDVLHIEKFKKYLLVFGNSSYLLYLFEGKILSILSRYQLGTNSVVVFTIYFSVILIVSVFIYNMSNNFIKKKARIYLLNEKDKT